MSLPNLASALVDNAFNRTFASLKQTLTCWKIASTNQYGQQVFGAPVTVVDFGFWSSTAELFVDDSGERRKADSKIMLNRDVIDEGDYVFPGTSTEADPKGVDGALTIVSKHKVPDHPSATNLIVLLAVRG